MAPNKYPQGDQLTLDFDAAAINEQPPGNQHAETARAVNVVTLPIPAEGIPSQKITIEDMGSRGKVIRGLIQPDEDRYSERYR